MVVYSIQITRPYYQTRVIHLDDESVFREVDRGSGDYYLTIKKDVDLKDIEIKLNVDGTVNITGDDGLSYNRLEIWKKKENVEYIFIVYDKLKNLGSHHSIKPEDYKLYEKIFFNDKKFNKIGLLGLVDNDVEFTHLKQMYAHEGDRERLRNPYLYSIYKYQYTNYLDFDEKIRDGFFDVGLMKKGSYKSASIANFKKGGLLFANISRNIIVCDRTKDSKLKTIMGEMIFCFESLKKYTDNKIDYTKFAKIILNRIQNLIEDSDDIEYHTQISDNIEYIGNIKKGVCRHYAILYKYVIDNLDDDNIKCRLVRGGDGCGRHSWNVIDIKNKDMYMVDPRNRDTLLSGSEFETMFPNMGLVDIGRKKIIKTAMRGRGYNNFRRKYLKYSRKLSL